MLSACSDWGSWNGAKASSQVEIHFSSLWYSIKTSQYVFSSFLSFGKFTWKLESIRYYYFINILMFQHFSRPQAVVAVYLTLRHKEERIVGTVLLHHLISFTVRVEWTVIFRILICLGLRNKNKKHILEMFCLQVWSWFIMTVSCLLKENKSD